MRTRRQLFARSACRSLLWGVGFFALFQLLLTLALEFWWTRGRDPFYGAKVARLKGRLRQAPDSRVVVMVGSSRTGDGLRAVPFETELAHDLGQPLVIFNFGLPGAGPPTQLLQLQRLLAEGIKPSLVLIEILPVDLDDRLGVSTLRLAAERLSWHDLQQIRTYPLHAHPLRQAWREARLVPWYAQRFNILSAIMPTLLPLHLRQDSYVNCDSCGWSAPAVGRHSPEERQWASARALKSYRPKLDSFQIGPASCQAVRLILHECHHHAIQAACVLMPEGPDFRSAYSERIWQQINPFLDQLQQEFQAPIVNARDWIEEENFFDSHHLAPDGAAQFTERLAREAILPLLGQRR